MGLQKHDYGRSIASSLVPGTSVQLRCSAVDTTAGPLRRRYIDVNVHLHLLERIGSRPLGGLEDPDGLGREEAYRQVGDSEDE
jgi:hypothetical protein